MIKETFKSDKEKCGTTDPTKGFSLVMLSLATSMDALGVGISLALYPYSIFLPASVIGVICCIATLFGIYFGKISKRFTGKYAEVFGAVVLIIIGIKFLGA